METQEETKVVVARPMVVEAKVGPLLSDREIERLVQELGIIEPFEVGLLSGCSYDLRIGRPIRSRNRSRVFDLSKRDYSIESGECITFETMESLNFRVKPLFGFIVNKHSILAKGLVHPITKVDPGFHGPLAVTLFNQGNKAETLQYGQPLVSLVILAPSEIPERIYGDTQRPSYKEGSLDIAAIGNEPEEQLDDKGLSKMYGAAVSRLYERVEELERRFDVGLIKYRQERSRRLWEIFWRLFVPLVAVVLGAVINQNWAVVSSWLKAHIW